MIEFITAFILFCVGIYIFLIGFQVFIAAVIAIGTLTLALLITVLPYIIVAGVVYAVFKMLW